MEGGQERWYKHGNPTQPSGTIYNITTGHEIEKPRRATRVTLQSHTEKTWVFHKGTEKSERLSPTEKKLITNHAEICYHSTGPIREHGRWQKWQRN